MEILLGMLIAITSIFLVLVLRILTTFFHEMGHAVPALLFTSNEVNVFIGTYGDESHSRPLKLGRLRIHFRFQLLAINLGLCTHKHAKYIWQELLILIGGPVASLLVAIPLLYLVVHQVFSDISMALVLIFALAALIDFFVNIVPVGTTIEMQNGAGIYNDGYQIYVLLTRITLPEGFFVLEQDFEEKSYTEVISGGEALILEGHHKRAIYELLAKAYIEEKQFDKAIDIYHRLNKHHKFKYQDYREMGNIYRQMNKFEEALQYFDHCLHLKYTDTAVLNDRAYLKIQAGDYDGAITDLDAAIFYAPTLPNAYLNRGLAKIRTQDFQEAYADLMLHKEMNVANPLLPYYLGLYYEKQHKYEEALVYYEEAKAMKISDVGIDYTIEMVKKQL